MGNHFPNVISPDFKKTLWMKVEWLPRIEHKLNTTKCMKNCWLCSALKVWKIYFQPNPGVTPPETRFRLAQTGQFVTLESLRESGRHVGILQDGQLKPAVATGKEMDAHFGVKLVVSISVQCNPYELLTLVLLSCLFIFFIHLKLELPTQFPALIDEKKFYEYI